ncbi:hypothetical protein [Corynebacterium aquatimens]|uniref:Alpha helical Porin B n=1 Tax=Corynebacterium aquatimens TaxID=1190508 RepID=A0A931DZR8_9CORY|nr:hypothetical protein [Corynebacterium aquatimens]MBG6122059.1 hypothetical protein [Corynebacterium aquatimens]WJY65400.1 Alpha helical Porin B [Corynebacterium aquatimens]
MRISHKIALGTIASAAAIGAVTAMPAQADLNLTQLQQLANGGIATADCNVVKSTLRGTSLVDGTTTRSQLVDKLNTQLGQGTATRLLAGSTVNAIADRALECEAVKPDPVTPQSQAIDFASQISSRAGLPELRTILPLVQGSSQAK